MEGKHGGPRIEDIWTEDGQTEIGIRRGEITQLTQHISHCFENCNNTCSNGGSTSSSTCCNLNSKVFLLSSIHRTTATNAATRIIQHLSQEVVEGKLVLIGTNACGSYTEYPVRTPTFSHSSKLLIAIRYPKG